MALHIYGGPEVAQSPGKPGNLGDSGAYAMMMILLQPNFTIIKGHIAASQTQGIQLLLHAG
jgi:hypothetical protein